MERTVQFVNAVSAVTTVGFQFAKFGTNLGFGIARGITSTVITSAGTAIDYAITGRTNGTGLGLSLAVSSVFGLAESVAIGSIAFGERITTASLAAASGSVDLLSGIFENDEASFSLAAFGQLVRREWNAPLMAEHLPEKRYSLPAMIQALMAWAAIQNVTQFYTEIQWFQAIREIHIDDTQYKQTLPRSPKEDLNHFRVTNDFLLPGANGQIVSAEIGHATDHPVTKSPSRALFLPTLRRLSKLVLAGYGGVGMMFFGVPLEPFSGDSKPNFRRTLSSEAVRNEEEAVVKDVLQSSEVQDEAAPTPDPSKFSWWNILTGKHDREIFEGYAFNSKSTSASSGSALLISELRMPRFWILTDHERKEVVLVLRGTMSLNELAVDLTCDPSPFSPASPFSRVTHDSSPPPHTDEGAYEVHGGMLKLAQAMGSPDKPVHNAVKQALNENKGYDLILCGHSLGAGIAALFALMWADPKTCLTVESSGLPPNHKVAGYLFAPPCLASKELSEQCRDLLTSLVYSHDVVSRLSLGSARDLTRAAAWLCTGEGDERPLSIVRRAIDLRRGTSRPLGSKEDEVAWFLSLRKTLEANMTMAHLFPPGRVLWALEDQDFQPSFRTSSDDPLKVRLFEVLHVDKVFNRIVFSRQMLGSHMPVQHDRIINQLVSQ